MSYRYCMTSSEIAIFRLVRTELLKEYSRFVKVTGTIARKEKNKQHGCLEKQSGRTDSNKG